MKRPLFLVLLSVVLCLPVFGADVTTSDGISYDLNGTEATVVAGDYSNLVVAVIPDVISEGGTDYSVTAIAPQAFSGCTALRHVSIPASMTSIGENAFRNCSLTSLSTYASLDCAGAFTDCSVSNLYVAAGVTELKGLGINPSTIYCFGDEPPVCDDATFTSYRAALHVTVKAMTGFFIDEVWSRFNNLNSDAGEQPETLTISETELTLSLGDTHELGAAVTPFGNVPIVWISTNPQVVSVTDGQLTAHVEGEAVIIASCMGLCQQCHVIVYGPKIVATINVHDLSLKRGNMVNLSASTSPISTNVTWASTNTDVALVRVVNGEALVLANLPGEALIVATPEGTNVQPDTCRVTVIRPDGDINCDGLVDVSDVNLMIDFVLGKKEAEINKFSDLDDNGIIDVSDVNAIIDIVLGKVKVKTQTFTVNGVSFTMVDVKGGTFTMGATAEQGSDYYSNERPTHQVTLSDFSIGATEVTQELWVAVMGSNPSCFNGYGNSDYGSYHISYNYGRNLQRPVESVSWNDCQTFITKLNALTGKTFRLPTEAEWEYAARGGKYSQSYKYAGSNMLGDVAWYWDNIPSQSFYTPGYGTQPVATMSPNELGLYDMSGNVWEWCSDWFGSYSSDAQTNPTGPASSPERVNRGGSWGNEAGYCRVSNRRGGGAGLRSDYLGLRLAL